jgi:hypothetical protein
VEAPSAASCSGSSSSALVKFSVQASSIDSYAASSAAGVTATPSAQTSTATPIDVSSDDEDCKVQYVHGN